MKVGVLYSGGKDSTLAMALAKESSYKISCLISMVSLNKESYMFHTPSIERVGAQAEVIGAPLVIQETEGKEEEELKDLKKAILRAKKEYGFEGIVTGAVESCYQASRVQKICDELDIECFNPLWQKNQKEILSEVISRKFEVIVVGVFAYPLEKSFLGRKIDSDFVEELEVLEEKYKINVAGEGGEYETFVLNCPLFSRPLKVVDFEDFGEGNSWRREVVVE